MRRRSRKLVIGIFCLFATVYIMLALLLPPDARTLNKYNLSSEGAKILGLTIVLPYIVIWFTALYGYLKCKAYAARLGKSDDGKAFSKIAGGLLALALSMPISTIVSNITTYYGQHHSRFLPTGVIISNYVSLIVLIVAFYLLFRGSGYLRRVLPQTRLNSNSLKPELSETLFILVSVAYGYFTLTNPAREHPSGAARTATYYLPDWLLLTSIVIPYIAIMYWGFSTVWNLRLYRLTIPGLLYKRALRSLWVGIFLALSSVMLLRILSSMSGWFENRGLKTLLLILYLLLIFIGIGYGFIARGARKLTKIEDVV